VLLAVFFGCLARVMHGVLVMPMSRVRMVSSFLVLARFVMFRRFFVMPCGLLVVLGGFAMMLCGVSGHGRGPPLVELKRLDVWWRGSCVKKS
jgi:hypothetical protein